MVVDGTTLCFRFINISPLFPLECNKQGRADEWVGRRQNHPGRKLESKGRLCHNRLLFLLYVFFFWVKVIRDGNLYPEVEGGASVLSPSTFHPFLIPRGKGRRKRHRKTREINKSGEKTARIFFECGKTSVGRE